jgi:hypothetical protein
MGPYPLNRTTTPSGSAQWIAAHAQRSVDPQVEGGAKVAQERVRERVHELRGGPAALLLRRLYLLSMQRLQRPLAFLDGLPGASWRRGVRREAWVHL